MGGRIYFWRPSLWPGGRVSRSLHRARLMSHPCAGCMPKLVSQPWYRRCDSRRGWGGYVCLTLVNTNATEALTKQDATAQEQFQTM
jgi:hypothetical protein